MSISNNIIRRRKYVIQTNWILDKLNSTSNKHIANRMVVGGWCGIEMRKFIHYQFRFFDQTITKKKKKNDMKNSLRLWPTMNDKHYIFYFTGHWWVNSACIACNLLTIDHNGFIIIQISEQK